MTLEFPCLEWLGTRTGDQYGQLTIDGKVVYAHRRAWELEHGLPIPKGMCILHKCDNPPCVEPTHLFLGTRKDNVEDMDRKGRRGKSSTSIRTVVHLNERTHCKNGHPLHNGGLVRNSDNRWCCLYCRRKQALAYYHRKRRHSIYEHGAQK